MKKLALFLVLVLSTYVFAQFGNYVGTIQTINLKAETDRFSIFIAGDGKLEPNTVVIDNPPRIALDFPNVRNMLYPKVIEAEPNSYVHRIRTSLYAKGRETISRVTVDLKNRWDYSLFRTKDGVVLSVAPAFKPGSTQAAPKPEATTKTPPSAEEPVKETTTPSSTDHPSDSTASPPQSTNPTTSTDTSTDSKNEAPASVVAPSPSSTSNTSTSTVPPLTSTDNPTASSTVPPPSSTGSLSTSTTGSPATSTEKAPTSAAPPPSTSTVPVPSSTSPEPTITKEKPVEKAPEKPAETPAKKPSQTAVPQQYIPAPARQDPSASVIPFTTPPSQDIVIGSEDLLEVSVFELPQFNTTARVQGDGTITMPLVGSIEVRGLKKKDVEIKIATALQAKYVNNANVSVNVKEYKSRQVSVLGEVKSPGAYYVMSQRTLLQLLSEAGGLTNTAGPKCYVFRPGAPKIEINLRDLMVNGNPELNILIYPGDVVNVPTDVKIIIYVLGAVRLPGAVQLSTSMPVTLLAAIAGAGGPSESAKQSDVRIKRKNATGEENIIKVNLKDIMKGKVEDIPLFEGDMVTVPESFF